MKTALISVAMLSMLAACASPAPQAENDKQAKTTCMDETPTGSHISKKKEKCEDLVALTGDNARRRAEEMRDNQMTVTLPTRIGASN